MLSRITYVKYSLYLSWDISRGQWFLFKRLVSSLRATGPRGDLKKNCISYTCSFFLIKFQSDQEVRWMRSFSDLSSRSLFCLTVGTFGQSSLQYTFYCPRNSYQLCHIDNHFQETQNDEYFYLEKKKKRCKLVTEDCFVLNMRTNAHSHLN